MAEEQINPVDQGLIALRKAMAVLEQNKPTERGELARRYAVTITELEKVIGYYWLYIIVQDGLIVLEPGTHVMSEGGG